MAITELVVLSGKGGTGKTTVTASFAALAPGAILADCDVDAPDLHLILKPETVRRHDFISGNTASIRRADCGACGACYTACRFGAIERKTDERNWPYFEIDPLLCEGCAVCAVVCPANAVDLTSRHCGEWMVSNTRFGHLAHAQLGTAAENSGKLVTQVRRAARELAESLGASRIITDGSPGIGCPVIASISGASHLLVVAEPTVSGLHDMERVLELAAHFNVPASVCVNKWDLYPEFAGKVEATAGEYGAAAVGRIRYDPGVTAAQNHGLAAVEASIPAASDIRAVWARMCDVLETEPNAVPAR